MAQRPADHLLPTTVIGSHSLPVWLWAAQEKILAGAYGETDIAETLNDAVTLAILDQEEAGVDLISDGEMHRQEFTMGFYQYLRGVEELPPLRKAGYPGYDSHPRYRAAGKLEAPQGLGLRAEFAYSKTRAHKPLKVTCPGPLTLVRRVVPQPAYQEPYAMSLDMARIINAELRGLVADGAQWIQIDEPAMTRFTAGRPLEHLTSPLFAMEVQQMVALFNATVEGVAATITLHICFGNYRSINRSKRTYRPLFPYLLEARCDHLALEFANRELAESDLWREFPNDKDLVAGVIDVKSYYVESAEDVAERLRRLLEYVPAAQLWVAPDCGFVFLPRWLAQAKLRALVRGAEIVRKELGS